MKVDATARIVDAIKQFGTPERTVSCLELASYLELPLNVIQSRVAVCMKSQRNIHRKGVHVSSSKRRTYVYWWDDSKLNPLFGLKVLEKTRRGVPIDRKTKEEIQPEKPAMRPDALNFFWRDDKAPKSVPPSKPVVPIWARPTITQTLTFNSGSVQVTAEELRCLYGQLKDYFG